MLPSLSTDLQLCCETGGGKAIWIMVDDRTSKRRKSTSGIAQAYRDSHEVMSIVLSIAVFVGGGFWLDSKYGWTPVMTICGLVIGCLLAAVSLKQFLQKLDQRSRQRRDSLAEERTRTENSAE